MAGSKFPLINVDYVYCNQQNKLSHTVRFSVLAVLFILLMLLNHVVSSTKAIYCRMICVYSYKQHNGKNGKGAIEYIPLFAWKTKMFADALFKIRTGYLSNTKIMLITTELTGSVFFVSSG